jgi:hypothetical protein
MGRPSRRSPEGREARSNPPTVQKFRLINAQTRAADQMARTPKMLARESKICASAVCYRHGRCANCPCRSGDVARRPVVLADNGLVRWSMGCPRLGNCSALTSVTGQIFLSPLTNSSCSFLRRHSGAANV